MTQNNNGDALTSHGSATPSQFYLTDSSLSQENSLSTQSNRKKSGITEVSKSEPCPHCGKSDWCYFIDDLSVCNRDAEPAPGWRITSKRDREGHNFYAPIQSDKTLSGRANLRVVSTPPKKYKPAPLPKGKIVLAEFPEQPETPTIIQRGLNTEIIYPYSSTQWIVRIDYYTEDGKRTHKTTKPWHVNSDGEKVNSKGEKPWPIYRLSEVKQFALGKWVLGNEGEKPTDAARLYLWLVSITWMGSEWNDRSIEAGLIQIRKDGAIGLVHIADNDEAGRKKAAKIATAAAKLQFPCLIVNALELWDKMPDKGDIYDWIMGNPDWTREQFIEKMNRLINLTADRFSQELTGEPLENFGSHDGEDTTDNLAFCQLAFQELYTNTSWIYTGNSLYKWEGKYYRQVSDGAELARITTWCNSYAVPSYNKKTGRIINTYPYANNERVTQVLRWVKTSTYKDLEFINPPGLNCLNGILQIFWDGGKPSWQLIPHSPDYYYTYPPLVEYNPNADPEHCDRLLSALDAPQRDIFLKVIAASLDIHTVRKLKGRLIKALLLIGTGSNGKDAIREAITTIYGKKGVTSVTLTDFHQYDHGRRFPLSCLVNSRINWASENTNTSKLDQIQSLKAAITGNQLICEAKGKDGIEFHPLAIFLFNINETPNMTGVMEAILSRFGIINFNKTFKIGADLSKGELEADPRFAYDPLFLRLMVCPALLNRLLEALVDLIANGIDYTCTQQALEDIQAENSHLFRFAQDTGLTYSSDSYLSAAEIWEKLEQWYLDNGTLVYEEISNGKKKAIWADQPRKGDRNIKAVNQILARFKQLFPQTKLGFVPYPKQRRNLSVIHGITFDLDKSILNKIDCVAIREDCVPVGVAIDPCGVRVQTTRTNFSNSEEDNQKNDILLLSNNDSFSYPEQKVEKLVRTALHPYGESILGTQIGTQIGTQDDLIATHSTLLRIGSFDDVVHLSEIEVQVQVQGVIDNIRELISLNADWGTFQQYLVALNESLKKEAFKQLLTDELEILKTLVQHG